MALIQEARRNLQAQADLKEKQKKDAQDRIEADAICRQLRLDCESILESPQATKKRLHPYFVHRSLTLPFPTMDRASIGGEINNGNGQPLHATIERSLVRPFQKDGEIKVMLEGLNEHIVLGKGRAYIEKEKPDDYTSLFRKVSLPEAQSWQAVVGALKEQFPQTTVQS